MTTYEYIVKQRDEKKENLKVRGKEKAKSGKVVPIGSPGLPNKNKKNTKKIKEITKIVVHDHDIDTDEDKPRIIKKEESDNEEIITSPIHANRRRATLPVGRNIPDMLTFDQLPYEKQESAFTSTGKSKAGEMLSFIAKTTPDVDADVPIQKDLITLSTPSSHKFLVNRKMKEKETMLKTEKTSYIHSSGSNSNLLSKNLLNISSNNTPRSPPRSKTDYHFGKMADSVKGSQGYLVRHGSEYMNFVRADSEKSNSTMDFMRKPSNKLFEKQEVDIIQKFDTRKDSDNEVEFKEL